MKKKRKHLPPALRKAKHLAEAALVYPFFGICRLLPVETASNFGGWTGRVFGRVMSGASRRALRHIGLAFPEKTDAEKNIILRGMWDNLGRVAAEYAHLPALKKNLEIVGAEYVLAAQDAKRPVLLVSGHFANWEVGPMACRDLDLDIATVYRRPNNPYVADLLERLRRTTSATLLNKGREAVAGIAQRFSTGGVVGLLLDQALNKGIAAPFFGYRAMTAHMPILMALRAGAAILPVEAVRVSGCRMRLTVHPAMIPDGTQPLDAQVVEIVFRINAFLEKHIRAHPEQWLWLHRRWGKMPVKFNQTETVS